MGKKSLYRVYFIYHFKNVFTKTASDNGNIGYFLKFQLSWSMTI